MKFFKINAQAYYNNTSLVGIRCYLLTKSNRSLENILETRGLAVEVFKVSSGSDLEDICKGSKRKTLRGKRVIA